MDDAASGDIGSSHGPHSEKIVWTSNMEHRFIQFMHEKFMSHRLQSSTFLPSVWARICEKMNSAVYPSYIFTIEQLKGKLNRLRRSWRLMNDILNRGTGWGWDSQRHTITDETGRLEELYRDNPEYKKIVKHGLPHFDLYTQMFARNTAAGGFARSGTNPPHAFQTSKDGDNEQMTGTSSGGRRSRDDYEDTAVFESSPGIGTSSGSKRQERLGARVLQSKKCETMDKLNESLQAKIDRICPKATESIERYVDELTTFKDLPDIIFTTALERFHSHSTHTIFLHLDDENKLRWLYSLGKTPGTPGSPGSNKSDVPEEFYFFKDLICPKLFRENVARNTSVLQGEGWIAEIMSTPHAGRFYDNIRITKPCFYALVVALSSRGLLPQGQTARLSNIEDVAIFMQTVGMHRRQRDSMERFQHSLETIHRRFHRVLSALCALAPKMITRPNWTNTHPKIALNPDFYPYFKVNSNANIASPSSVYMQSNSYPISKIWQDCIGAMDGTLVPAWAPRVDQNRYRSRKGRIAQNVLTICDFDMNFTYVYTGWEGSAVDARVLDDAISQDRTFSFPPSGKYYLVDAEFANYQCFLAPYRVTRYHLAEYRGQGRQYAMTYAAYLTRAGFPQEEHWSLEMERRFMWMILDANAAIPMSDDQVAEGQMAYWSRAMRRHGGYPYTREQIQAKFYEFKDRYRTFHALTQVQGVAYDCNTMWIVVPNSVQEQITRMYPLARRYFIYPQPLYPSMLEVWGRAGVGRDFEEEHTPSHHDDNRSIGHGHSPGDRDSPIVISDSIARQHRHTHVGSWDEEHQVANATEGARLRRTASIGPRRSVDMGFGTGGIGSWTDYIRCFGLGSSRGGRTASEGIAPPVHATEGPTIRTEPVDLVVPLYGGL
ncbi:UNVERIFIED_CONTAM: hypothetical protein Sradi_3762500 [Sesamum radiatum]|uniref:Myb/SANT-like domain-containing protein n=1 Tax=Sesamum radiatum TaxID=300843 RepID=A0AAW2PZL2_SESRA